MIRRLGIGATAAMLVLTTAPAQAATKTVYDSYEGSIPALNVKSGTFRYGASAAVIRVRFEAVSRRKTVLVAKYYRRDGVTIQVMTKFVDGQQRVVVHRYDSTSYRRLSSRYVTARWDFLDDVIQIRLGEELLRGPVAGFHAWSQHKGAQEGSPSGDELYVAKLRRG